MTRILRHYITPTVSSLLLSEVALLLSCYVISAYLVLAVDPEIYLLHDRGLVNVVVTVITILLGMYFQETYTNLRVRSLTLVVQQVCTAIGLAFLMQSFLNYVDPQTVIPRWHMLTGSVMSLVGLTLLRIFYSRVVTRGIDTNRVLFLGRNTTVQRITERIQAYPELGMKVLGYLSDEDSGEPARLGDVSRLREVVEQMRPDSIVVGMTDRRQRLPMYELLDLRFNGVRIEEASATYEQTHHRVSVPDLRPADLVFTGGDFSFLTKVEGIYSWFLALIGFVLTFPVMAVVWILVKVTSPGPALYWQLRSGRNGEPFWLVKFRSMRVDAEAGTGAVWASKNDPRVTPLGKWLRRLRLDELPQFVNVLRGEMNLVGPRPERPEFVRTLQEQIPFYRQRLAVKPGLTGWAQINHKYGDTIEDTVTKLEYDLYYIKHRSLGLDTYIMLQTIKVMLLHKGAQ